VKEAADRIENARQPVFLLGVEVHRFGLQDVVLELAEASGIPMAAKMLGKGVVAETHPLYMGLYEGAIGPADVTKYVEASDCVVMLGTFMTDINLGIYTTELDIADCIYATSEQLRIRHHHYHEVRLEDFLAGLVSRGLKLASLPPPAPTDWNKDPFVLQPEAKITIDRLDEQLDDATIVIADIGDALFASTELTTRGRTDFLSPAYCTSMGFSVPAALGALEERCDRNSLLDSLKGLDPTMNVFLPVVIFFFAGVVAVTDRNSHRHDGVHAHRIVARVSQIPISLGFHWCRFHDAGVRIDCRAPSASAPGDGLDDAGQYWHRDRDRDPHRDVAKRTNERKQETERRAIDFRRGGALGACQEPLGRTTT